MGSTDMETIPMAVPKLAIEADTVEDHYSGEQSYRFKLFNPTVHSGSDHSGNIVPRRADAVLTYLPTLRVPADIHY
eukprot:6962821-Pyramimonas_sp.AAC.1